VCIYVQAIAGGDGERKRVRLSEVTHPWALLVACSNQLCPASRATAGPMLLRGALTTFRHRCGKASCWRAAGEPHQGPALTYTEGSRTKTVTLSGAEVAGAAATVQYHEQARAGLDAAADAGIAALRARRAGRKGGLAFLPIATKGADVTVCLWL
jgi:hypothetical protein